MAKVLEHKFLSDYSFSLDYLVEKEEYQKFSDRVRDQLRKTVSVPGFRPGMAPADIADKELDPVKVNSIIYQETIQKFAAEANTEVEKLLEIKGRKVLNVEATIMGEGLGNRDDGGFAFRLLATILPEINVEPAKKMKVKAATDEEISKNRKSFEDTLQARKQMLIDMVNKDLESRNEEAIKTVTEALEKNPAFKDVYKDEKNFEESYRQMYDSETEYLRQQAGQQKIIRTLIDTVPDFQLPEGVIDAEVKRIVESVEKEAENSKKTLSEILEVSGIPNEGKVKVENKEDLQKVINIYVSSEIKLMWILRFVYENYAETKLQAEEIEDLGRKMQAEPNVYGIPAGRTQEQYFDMAFDRLMRARAFDVVSKWVTPA